MSGSPEKPFLVSPCIGVCRLKNDRCIGCSRTIDQIRDWLRYDDSERWRIIKQLRDKRNIYTK